MQAINTFVTTIWQSIYSPQFYKNSVASSFGRAFGYFFFLIFLLTLIQSIFPIWTFATAGQKAIEKFVTQTVSYYPANLQITVKNGKVSTNVQEPYIVPLAEPSQTIQNVLVIDTKTPFSMEKFNEYNTAVWVTKDAIIIPQSNTNHAEARVIDLSQVSDFTLDKNVIETTVTRFLPLVKWLPVIVGIAILFELFFVYMLRLVYVFFLALCVWVLLKIMGRSLSYGNAYKVSLYAMTAGFLLDLFLMFIHQSGFPFLFTLISLGIVFVNFLPQKRVAIKTVKTHKRK